MKKIDIHPSFTKKVFQMAIQKNGEELDLSTTESQVDFMCGFIDSLEKEAHLNPSQALGVLKYITGIGFVEMLDKKASTEEEGKTIDELFDDMQNKIARATSFEWTRPIDSLKEVAEDAGQQAGINTGINEVKKTFGFGSDEIAKEHKFDIFSPLTSMAKMRGENKGIESAKAQATSIKDSIGLGEGGFLTGLKDSGFLEQIAPAAIGALGGYLIPKMFGSENGLMNAGLGAAAGYGAKKLWDSKDPESWEKFKNDSLDFISGKGKPVAQV